MRKTQWRAKIKKATEAAGTYQPCFDAVIDTLAAILEQRDTTLEFYEKTGGVPIVKHTNKGGSTNPQQHPALRLVNDLNRDALAYWRDLGLTPAGLRRINEQAVKPKAKSALAEALSEFE